MFLRKNWLPISVFVLVIVAVGLYVLSSQPLNLPITSFKPVAVEKPPTHETAEGGHFHADGDPWHAGAHEAEAPQSPVKNTPEIQPDDLTPIPWAEAKQRLLERIAAVAKKPPVAPAVTWEGRKQQVAADPDLIWQPIQPKSRPFSFLVPPIVSINDFGDPGPYPLGNLYDYDLTYAVDIPRYSESQAARLESIRDIISSREPIYPITPEEEAKERQRLRENLEAGPDSFTPEIIEMYVNHFLNLSRTERQKDIDALEALGGPLTPEAEKRFQQEIVAIQVEGLDSLTAVKYIKSGLHEDEIAVEYAERAVREHPSAEAYHVLAWTLDDDAAAETALRRSVSMDPNYTRALRDLSFFIWEREPAEAIRYLKRAADLDTRIPKNNYLIGQCYERLGRYEKALKVYQAMPFIRSAFGSWGAAENIMAIQEGVPHIKPLGTDSDKGKASNYHWAESE